MVCRQLGYGNAVAYKSSAFFGKGTDPIWIDDSACTGSELTLANCFNNGPGNHNCGHNEDVGVVCKGIYNSAQQSHTIYLSVCLSVCLCLPPHMHTHTHTHTHTYTHTEHKTT